MMPTHSPFQLSAPARLRWITTATEHLIGLKTLNHYYRHRQAGMSTREFLRYTLEKLGIDYTVHTGSLDSITANGPVVVVANHPFGAIEGVILSELLLSRRDDIQVLANEYLERIPELADIFIGVDIFESEKAAQKNYRGIKKAMRHLRQGGLLLVFPAGEVSSIDWKTRQITDRTWNRIIGTLIRKTQATSVPIYIEGKNSKAFHIMGLVHPKLRTLMLAREMLNKNRQPIRLHIGDTINYSELKSFTTDNNISHYLRLNTYLMANRHASSSKPFSTNQEPVIDAIDSKLLAQDVYSLPAKCLLLAQGALQVYCAPAQLLPNILKEIGRLREFSFRQTGEGTGLEIDLDKYDQHYLHLFTWNTDKQEIAGAYRLGLVDRLLARQDIKALYSRSQFDYDHDFIESLGPSIEMGRSFICPGYQRSLNALLLLWKGIATFVYRNPGYTTLFGPVSISNDYSELSRFLMASFLEIHYYDPTRAARVRPTNPQQKPKHVFWTRDMLAALADKSVISRLIARMEGGKGMPVLMRQYLKLNGRLVCFNVDKDFSNTLDGLIVVDLLNVPEKVLARYMGKQQTSEFFRRSLNE